MLHVQSLSEDEQLIEEDDHAKEEPVIQGVDKQEQDAEVQWQLVCSVCLNEATKVRIHQ